MIGGDGYTQEGCQVLAGDIRWKEIPNDPEIKAWLKKIQQTGTEKKLPPIKGQISKKDFQGAFRAPKENTS